MKSFKLIAFAICIVITTCCQSQVIIISGSDPLGPASLEEAINDLQKGFFQTRAEELKSESEIEFIESYVFDVSRYIRRKWGVLGGPTLYKEISQDSSFRPKFLTKYVLSTYFRTYHGNIGLDNSKSVIDMPNSVNSKSKTYKMQLKIRDGINLPNRKFEVAQIEVNNGLNTSLGTLYPTGTNVGDLVIKRPLDTYLRDWLTQNTPEKPNKVKITINDFYAEIAARTFGTEMAVCLDVDISTSEFKRNFNYTEFFDPNMVYTGANVNKALENLLEKALKEFNNEL